MIRDVGGSYRRAIAETVHHFSGSRPDPAAIDALKAEGLWNNDWQASMELLRRSGNADLPDFESLVAVFNGHYFGGDPEGDPAAWRGFIGSEPLLVERPFFEALSAAGLAWGFVSGAEPPSARFVLETRLGLADPPLVAMGEAPDKPDPTGLLRLAASLAGTPLGPQTPPVAYLGDTVADVRTVLNARALCPQQRFLALGVAPPHLQEAAAAERRSLHERQLRQAGADRVIAATDQVLAALEGLLAEA